MSKQQVVKVFKKWYAIYESVKGTSVSFIDFAVLHGINYYDAEHYWSVQLKPNSKHAKYPYKYH